MNVNLRKFFLISLKLFIPSFLIFNFSFFISSTFAQEKPETLWSSTGIIVNDTQGNTPQEKPVICSDNQGNYIVVWEDGRAGYADLYAQKFDEEGRLLWSKDGVVVCNQAANQNSPRLISDGAGGVIIVWQDYRDGNADLYAQHLSATGKLLWEPTGLPICTAPAGQFGPEIASDGTGGGIIVWTDYRSGSGEDIYAQRLSGDGQLLWTINGTPISTAKGTQWYPQIASDNAGGAVIAWTDGRLSSLNTNIVAQHVDANGKPLWDPDGLPICEADGNQDKPVLLSVADGVIIAWQDNRAQNIDLYIQKLAWDGKIRWGKDGISVCNFPYSQEYPRLSPDGSGGAIVIWVDLREENSDLYAQRIYSDGNIAWTENGRPVCQARNEQLNPQIVKLKTEDWLVIWEDSVGGKNKIDLFAQKLNSSGTPLWDERGIPIAAFPGEQKNCTTTITPQGNVIVVWEDTRAGGSDIVGQKISANGLLLWDKTGQLLCAAQGSVIQQNIQLAATTKGEVVVAFEDARSGFSNVYAQKVTADGSLAWQRNALPVAKAAANQFKPTIISDGKGGVYIAWEDYRLADQPTIRLQRLDSSGRPAWQSSLAIAKAKGKQTSPLMISDSMGGAILVWEDSRDILNLVDLYVQRVSPQGKLLWGDQGKSLIAYNSEQVEAAITADGNGGAFISWTDYRRGDRNPDIYAQRLNHKGEFSWPVDGVQVCGAPDVQKDSKIIADGEGGALVAWTDKGGGSYDIYAQRLDKAGRTLWLADGIPVSQASRTQQKCQFSNRRTLVWEDYRYGNWDIFGQALSPTGKLLWPAEGVAVSKLPGTQYGPQVASWRDGSTIVVWEDYRSGQHYELFMQRFGSDGNITWDENGVHIFSRDGGRAPKIITTPGNDSFYVFWEDYSNGGRAICGQRYLLY
jgi:hypothetical protein